VSPLLSLRTGNDGVDVATRKILNDWRVHIQKLITHEMYAPRVLASVFEPFASLMQVDEAMLLRTVCYNHLTPSSNWWHTGWAESTAGEVGRGANSSRAHNLMNVQRRQSIGGTVHDEAVVDEYTLTGSMDTTIDAGGFVVAPLASLDILHLELAIRTFFTAANDIEQLAHNHEPFGLILVDTTGVKQTLRAQARHLGTSIMSTIAKLAQQALSALDERYEQMLERMQETPANEVCICTNL
jgi:hypothetical protein